MEHAQAQGLTSQDVAELIDRSQADIAIDRSAAVARLSVVEELKRVAPHVPRILIVRALDGDIPAALAAVDIVFPGHGIVLGKGRERPEEALYAASIWAPGEVEGEDEAPTIGVGEVEAGLAQALIVALHDALTSPPDEAGREAGAVSAGLRHGDRNLPYLPRHDIAAAAGLNALRGALPDGDLATDIVQAAALMACEVLVGATTPENTTTCVDEFERNLRGLISRRLTADVAGHA